MGRIYTVEFEGIAVTGAVDVFELIPADDKPVRITGLLLGQSSDIGDAMEEILRLRIIRGHSTIGSGGTAQTPRPVRRSDAASGFTADSNNTTIASAGTPLNLLSHSFNIRSGLELMFPPEWGFEATQADGTIVVRLMAAPTDSLTMTGTLFVEEEG